MFTVGLLLAAAGCSDRGGSTTLEVNNEVAQKGQREELGRQLLTSGSDMLNNLDHFVEGGSDFRETSTEDAVKQTVRRLNEGLALLAADGAPKAELTPDDGKILREIVWLRDAARFAVGDATDPVERARRLFDWTIRNIQLIPDDASAEEKLPMLPWHIVIFGRGTALDRAWVFQLLARQQGLDVAILAPGDVTEAELKSAEGPRFWCVGLADAGSGAGTRTVVELFLFDTRWGTAIPVGKNAGPARLYMVAADDKLLRALDVDDKHPYPFKAADVQKLTALVETSSCYTQPQFASLENALASSDKLTLSIDEAKLVEKFAKLDHVAAVKPWPLRDIRYEATREKATYEALSKKLLAFNRRMRDMRTDQAIGTPPLWRARVRHVSGKYYENMEETDPELRKLMIYRWYQVARPAESDLENLELQTRDWEYLHRMKQHATYWLGLVAYDMANYETAATYLEKVLTDPANGGWTTGARYNLGRAYEAEAGATKDAAEATRLRKKASEVYRATYLNVPPDVECLYRAKRLDAAGDDAKNAK
ncbi:MAG: hypothetical protein QM775_08140 [Pirellulales bacterium]